MKKLILILTILLTPTICSALTLQEARTTYENIGCDLEVYHIIKGRRITILYECPILQEVVDVHKIIVPEPFQVVIEAEQMAVKTTGGPVTDGWSIWSNGYIENQVDFPVAKVYEFQITARGSVANGAWPQMELRINQIQKANFIVNKTTWETYTVQVNVAGGIQAVAVAFTNDLKTSTEDRNLYVDKIKIGEPSQ